MSTNGKVGGVLANAGNPRPRRGAALRLATVIAFAAVLNVIIFRITERYAGPITALCTVAFMTALVRRSGMRWADLGLRRPRPLGLLLAVPVIVLAAGGAAAIAAHYFPIQETGARFGNLAGNLPGTLWWISVGWVIGGFCEEMMFRGFVLNHFEALLPRGPLASVLAVVGQALIFGGVHVYNRGPHALVVLGAVGVVMGVAYLLLKRNLWPLILGHGLMNTAGFLGDYFG